MRWVNLLDSKFSYVFRHLLLFTKLTNKKNGSSMVPSKDMMVYPYFLVLKSAKCSSYWVLIDSCICLHIFLHNSYILFDIFYIFRNYLTSLLDWCKNILTWYRFWMSRRLLTAFMSFIMWLILNTVLFW